MKFAVYQIQLTDAQVDLINARGMSAVPAQIAKLDMNMSHGRSLSTAQHQIGGLASDAFEAGYYTHVCNIEAADYNDCFEVGNIGPEENIERLGRMSSLSVSDVIVADDGTCVVVAPMGFVAFSHNPSKVAA